MRWPAGTRLFLDSEPVYVQSEGDWGGWLWLSPVKDADPDPDGGDPHWHVQGDDDRLLEPLAWLKQQLHEADAHATVAGSASADRPAGLANTLADAVRWANAYSELADAVQLATATTDEDRYRTADTLAMIDRQPVESRGDDGAF